MHTMEKHMKPRPAGLENGTESPAVYIQQDVLDELWFNARWRTDRLSVGILVGNHYRCPSDGEVYVQIEGFVSGTHVPEISDLTRFLRSQWKAALSAQNQNMPTGEIVGWYVGTGSPQIEIGQDALLLHHTFFSQPWQVGIVLSGDNNVNALNVTGDEFRAIGMQTLHPSMNDAVPAS